MCLRFVTAIVALSLFAPALWADEPAPMLDAIEPVQVKQFVAARAQDARDLALGAPAPQMVMPTDLDCTALYNRRVAMMRGQVDIGPTDYFDDPKIGTGAFLGAIWTPAFYYLPFRTLQRYQNQQRRPQVQADIDALRAASAAQRCFEH